MKPTQAALCLVVLGLAAPLSSLAADYKYVSFLSMHGAPVDQFVVANGINDDGTIVGQDGNQGFIFAHGVTNYVSVAGATTTNLQAIDYKGDIIGIASAEVLGEESDFGFSDVKGILKPLLNASGGPLTVTGFNSLGQMITTSYRKQTVFGDLLRTKPSYNSDYRVVASHAFAVPGAYATLPTAINDRGQIVGFFYDSSGQHGFLFSQGVFTTLALPNGSVVVPRAINHGGVIVGTYSDPSVNGNSAGFVLSGGVYTRIFYPGAMGGTVLNGIGDGGYIAGYYYDNLSTGTTGFVAKPIL